MDVLHSAAVMTRKPATEKAINTRLDTNMFQFIILPNRNLTGFLCFCSTQSQPDAHFDCSREEWSAGFHSSSFHPRYYGHCSHCRPKRWGSSLRSCETKRSEPPHLPPRLRSDRTRAAGPTSLRTWIIIEKPLQKRLSGRPFLFLRRRRPGTLV